MVPQSKMGRPIVGAEPKSKQVKIRLEPYLSRQIDVACNRLGMTRASFVRYAIEQLIKSLKLNNYY